jgi:hypothetical protein
MTAPARDLSSRAGTRKVESFAPKAFILTQAWRLAARSGSVEMGSWTA